MSPELIIVIPLILMIPFMVYAFRRQAQLVQQWKEVGMRLGFEPYTSLHGASGQLVGTLHGVRVLARWEQRGSGKNRYTMTVLRIELPSETPIGLAVSTEGLMAKASKLIGAQDVQTGDALFDKTLLIKGVDEEEVREYFGPAHRREALLELGRAGMSWWIADGALVSEQSGLIPGERLESSLRTLALQAHRHLYGREPEGGAW